MASPYIDSMAKDYLKRYPTSDFTLTELRCALSDIVLTGLTCDDTTIFRYVVIHRNIVTHHCGGILSHVVGT